MQAVDVVEVVVLVGGVHAYTVLRRRSYDVNVETAPTATSAGRQVGRHFHSITSSAIDSDSNSIKGGDRFFMTLPRRHLIGWVF